MKDHIDVVTVVAEHNIDLKTKLNGLLKPNDEIVSVILTEARWATKTYTVVICRNVSKPTIKRVFKEENKL